MNDSRTRSNNKLLFANISEDIFLVFPTNSSISLQFLYLKQVYIFQEQAWSMFLTNNNQKKDNSIYEVFLMHM